MSTALDEAATDSSSPPAERLRTTTAAVRLSFTWFGTRKTLTAEQKALAAEGFGAEGQFLSAGKKLLDTRDPAFRKVTAVRVRVQSYWRGLTLPFPEPGMRLIRQQDVEPFDARMTAFGAELGEAVTELESRYSDLRSAARRRLGSLYNPADYPESLSRLFAVAWEFPSVEPPDYLRQLSPELFRQEQQRARARFEEAARLAEEAFAAELGRLVSHLAERLSGREDGRPKVFRDSAVENLREFFDRFRQLNVGSSAQLDQLVEQARRVVDGVAPQDLRGSDTLRQQVASRLAGVQSQLDGLMVDRPRRSLLRPSRAAEEG